MSNAASSFSDAVSKPLLSGAHSLNHFKIKTRKDARRVSQDSGEFVCHHRISDASDHICVSVTTDDSEAENTGMSSAMSDDENNNYLSSSMVSVVK